MKQEKIFIDIETDFKKRLLSIGFVGATKKSLKEEYFIWQNESKLHYPSDCDPKYIKVLEKWRNAEKTPIIQVLKRLKEISENNILIGWNISRFDIPILHNYMDKYLKESYTPMMFDACWSLSDIVQGNKKLDNLPRSEKTGKKSVAFENVLRAVTGMEGYIENHTALFDAQDERYIFKVLCQKYGKAYYNADKIKTYLPKVRSKKEKV